MSAPDSILVAVPQRIGDVLLATPLIRSLKRAWPGAQVDALVFEGTEGVLAGNPDLHHVVTVAPGAGAAASLRFARAQWRRYDLACSVVPSDRSTLYALCAGRRALGLVAEGAKHAWKRAALAAHARFDDRATHTVTMNLALADLAGAARCPEVVLSWTEADAKRVDAALGALPGGRPLAVLHPEPKFAYKRWHPAGWIELARWLAARGFSVIVTGSGEAGERQRVESMLPAMGEAAHSLAGQLSLGALACLLSRTGFYAGTDTVVTHMAAASGAPTLALFGPTNPVKWGPWPRDWTGPESPYALRGSRRAGNVMLLHDDARACVPCMQEGCERRLDSRADCLAELPARRVIATAEGLLEARKITA